MRGVEDLEDRALLVDAERGAVEQRFVGDGLGVVRRRRSAATPWRGPRRWSTSITIGGGADRRELLHRGARSRPRPCAAGGGRSTSCTGLAALQLLVEVALDAGQAGIVDAGVAHDVGGGRALRIDAPLLGLELEAGNAEAIDQVVLARAQAALDPDEALVAVELLLDLVVLELGQRRDDLARGILRDRAAGAD